MYLSIVDSKSNSLIELMVTGKLRLSFLPTPSWTTELRVFLMDNLTALFALETSATAAQRVCHSLKPSKLILVAMIARLMDSGNKVSTLVFIVIWTLSMLCAPGKAFP